MAVPSLFTKEKLVSLALSGNQNIHYQLSPEELTEQTVSLGQGTLTHKGALVIKTGEFTGRSPQDKFTVKDELTENAVNWNKFNIAISEAHFDATLADITEYLASRNELWVRDAYVCADPKYRLNIRVMNENPWSNLFCYNMFLRPSPEELENFKYDWQIFQAPGFKAVPAKHGTRQANFAMVSFKKRTILIGGTGYTGEMKKGIFSVLNFILPHNKNVLSMHCSANMGEAGDTAVFFGLSGTGKTTLSADPKRKLIGDDEHGWTEDTVFNFEGGCYAKTIDLSEEKEPEIFAAIKPGALLENIGFVPGTNIPDYADKSITENTRVSYPLHYINNVLNPAVGSVPKNIFFLTCDAYGVLPPISKLTTEQAMYQFISGYTAKVAGTEAGVTEPKVTFSACFGAPFLPLHPGQYAKMLGEKLEHHNVKVWLINTGWSGGAYGVGSRIKLAYTRACISAALEGKLDAVEYGRTPFFKLFFPKECTGVPTEILFPRMAWRSPEEFDAQAKKLAQQFIDNFKQYEAGVSQAIIDASPIVEI
jgi:phosphoenolpyruvate carboxykinase (ATP)